MYSYVPGTYTAHGAHGGMDNRVLTQVFRHPDFRRNTHTCQARAALTATRSVATTELASLKVKNKYSARTLGVLAGFCACLVRVHL